MSGLAAVSGGDGQSGGWTSSSVTKLLMILGVVAAASVPGALPTDDGFAEACVVELYGIATERTIAATGRKFLVVDSITNFVSQNIVAESGYNDVPGYKMESYNSSTKAFVATGYYANFAQAPQNVFPVSCIFVLAKNDNIDDVNDQLKGWYMTQAP